MAVFPHGDGEIWRYPRSAASMEDGHAGLGGGREAELVKLDQPENVEKENSEFIDHYSSRIM